MDLVTIEEIRQAKYRYLRCLDLKLWDEFADAFTEDAVAEYDTPVLGEPLRLAGRDAIVAYMREHLGPQTITSHLVSHPEIEVDGDDARGAGAWRTPSSSRSTGCSSGAPPTTATPTGGARTGAGGSAPPGTGGPTSTPCRSTTCRACG